MKLVKSIATFLLALVFMGSGNAFADDNFDVKIIKGSSINLVSQASRVPILIQNNYDTEVRVLVRVTTSNLRVRLPELTSVTIAPNSTLNAVIPVQAVANGPVKLYVSLTSFSGLPLGAEEVINMNVIGNAEAIGLSAMGGLVLLLLVIGSIRMIRRRRLSE